MSSLENQDPGAESGHSYQGPALGLSPPSLDFSCSEDAMEYSKEFVTAVVLGKDLVPR